MARNYTLPTIKTLFGEASACAYPGCGESLIFNDRGKATVVAQIAHIRSEKPNGPRHDPDYADELNGPANLLLLCGRHHPPVDRHESTYTIDELEVWKARQRAGAGDGTPLTDQDARAYARLDPEEKERILNMAVLTERVIRACTAAQNAMDLVRAQNERYRLQQARSMGPMYEIHDDGSKVLVTDTIQLSVMEQREWDAKIMAVRDAELPRVGQAINDLAEQASVLMMITPSLDHEVKAIQSAAELVVQAVGDAVALREAVGYLDGAKARLWQVANGLEDR